MWVNLGFDPLVAEAAIKFARRRVASEKDPILREAPAHTGNDDPPARREAERRVFAADVTLQVQCHLAVAAAEAAVDPAVGVEAGEQEIRVKVADDEDLSARQHLDPAQRRVVTAMTALEENPAALAESRVGLAVRPIGVEDAGRGGRTDAFFVTTTGRENDSVAGDGNVVELGAAAGLRRLAEDAVTGEARVERAVGSVAGDQRRELGRPVDAFLGEAGDHQLAGGSDGDRFGLGGEVVEAAEGKLQRCREATFGEAGIGSFAAGERDRAEVPAVA